MDEREREAEYSEMLGRRVVDISRLKEAAWFGVPEAHRKRVWLVLLNVLDYNTHMHALQIEKKIRTYTNSILNISNENSPAMHEEAAEGAKPDLSIRDKDKKQIEMDIRRAKGVVVGGRDVSQMYYRAMALTSRRRAAVGYVQGMCDIYGAFLEVFLERPSGGAEERGDLEAEAMSYFCFSKILDQVQDHFVDKQEGLQRAIDRIGGLIQATDPGVHACLQGMGLETKFFAYNWLATFLFREFRGTFLREVLDAHFSLGISEFLPFNEAFCASLVISLRAEILRMDFNDALTLLHQVGDIPWTHQKMREVLSLAFVIYSQPASAMPGSQGQAHAS